MNRMILPTFALMAVALAGAAGADSRGTNEWNFDVYLDDKEIGFHTFELDRVDDALVLHSEAVFKVKVLFLTAFRYEHNNREVWRDGCLRSIEARTDANGKEFNVKGVVDDGGFLLESADGRAPIDDCVATFAYWDRDLLERDRLLNSQTGEYLDVEFEEKPDATYRLGQREVDAERVHVSARGVDIVLTYAAGSGEWLALESRLQNGRTLSYRRSAEDLGPTRLAEVAR